jgi:hypothetical protein
MRKTILGIKYFFAMTRSVYSNRPKQVLKDNTFLTWYWKFL